MFYCSGIGTWGYLKEQKGSAAKECFDVHVSHSMTYLTFNLEIALANLKTKK